LRAFYISPAFHELVERLLTKPITGNAARIQQLPKTKRLIVLPKSRHFMPPSGSYRIIGVLKENSVTFVVGRRPLKQAQAAIRGAARSAAGCRATASSSRDAPM
jgi:hypothetical protein